MCLVLGPWPWVSTSGSHLGPAVRRGVGHITAAELVGSCQASPWHTEPNRRAGAWCHGESLTPPRVPPVFYLQKGVVASPCCSDETSGRSLRIILSRRLALRRLASHGGSLIWLYLEKAFGEGNGTPPQYSCLENPMDGGAW